MYIDSTIMEQRQRDDRRSEARRRILGVLRERAPRTSHYKLMGVAEECCILWERIGSLPIELFVSRLRQLEMRRAYTLTCFLCWVRQLGRLLDLVERMVEGDWCTREEAEEWLATAGLVGIPQLRSGIIDELKKRNAPINERRKYMPVRTAH